MIELTTSQNDKASLKAAERAAAWLSERLGVPRWHRINFVRLLASRLVADWCRNQARCAGSWPEDVPPVVLTCWPAPGLLLSEVLIETGMGTVVMERLHRTHLILEFRGDSARCEEGTRVEYFYSDGGKHREANG